MNPYHVIRRPRTSEKGHAYVQNLNTYIFEVDRAASKLEIKAAVEAIWEVKVKNVRTVTMPSKRRRFGRINGHTNPWKKAIVRLAKDQAIEALR